LHAANDSNIQRPLCVVTGANTGIGFEVARGLAHRDFRVVLACRDQAKGEAARNTIASEIRDSDIETLVVDLASQSSIRSAAQEFSRKHDVLDVLVNNAGMSSPKRRESPEGIELTFTEDAIHQIANFATLVNERTENIGARRLHTVMEKLLDEISFEGPDLVNKRVTIDEAYVTKMLADIVKNEDLSRYIL